MNALLPLTLLALAAEPEPQIIPLWPDAPPDETREFPEEMDVTKPDGRTVAGRRVTRLTNVTRPTLAVYQPPEGKRRDAAVIICPGGGHHVLAYDLEGTEVATWLNDIGVTGIVLKYRVPFRDPEQRWRAAVQDGQRAVSLVRSRAKSWGLDPKKIGILGFSAGGETAARTALAPRRFYKPVDDVDEVSARPDFGALIYPAYLADAEGQLREDVVVDKSAPPMFLVHAWDDRVTCHSSLALASALRRANVPAELHLFARGGHGYGLRRTEQPVTRWPGLCAAWLRESNLLPSE